MTEKQKLLQNNVRHVSQTSLIVKLLQIEGKFYSLAQYQNYELFYKLVLVAPWVVWSSAESHSEPSQISKVEIL